MPEHPPLSGAEAAALGQGQVVHPCGVVLKRVLAVLAADGSLRRLDDMSEVEAADAAQAGAEVVAFPDPEKKPRLTQQANVFLNVVILPPAFRIEDAVEWLKDIPEGWPRMSCDESAAFDAIYLREDERRLFCCSAPRDDGAGADVVQLRRPRFGVSATPAAYATLKAFITTGLNSTARAAGWGDHPVVTAYIDDTASTAPPDKAERWFAVLTSTLVGHGQRCNEAKSAPPAPSLEHVGLVFGPDRERVSLLPARQHMVERLSTVLAGGQATLEVWRSVAGRLRATSPVLGRRLGAAMYGAWGFLREFRCGCTDAKGI